MLARVGDRQSKGGLDCESEPRRGNLGAGGDRSDDLMDDELRRRYWTK